MKNLINKLKEQLEEYRELVKTFEKKGVENLSYEETETYGYYLGKIELLDDILPKMESL